jgi:hypothetical protein
LPLLLFADGSEVAEGIEHDADTEFGFGIFPDEGLCDGLVGYAGLYEGYEGIDVDAGRLDALSG